MVPSQTPSLFSVLNGIMLYITVGRFLGCAEWRVCVRTSRAETRAKAECVPRCGGHPVTCAELPHGPLDSLDFWQKLNAVSGSLWELRPRLRIRKK